MKLNLPDSTIATALSISGQAGLLSVTGLASTNRIKTVRDAADTILELGGSYTPTGTWTNLTLVTPALGTPSALVGTNITGTATAFNINGTVGATTPAAGTFTTITGNASGLTINAGGTNQNITLTPGGTGQVIVPTGSAAKPSIAFASHTTQGFYDGSGEIRLAISAADRFGWGTQNASNFSLLSDGSVTFSASASNVGAVPDTWISRKSAGITRFGTSSANSLGSWEATNGTFSGNLLSTTALATPSALSATQATMFASTVSGSSFMGYGTTNDVSLMNRAGTVVLGVGPNTTTVNIPGALTMGAGSALTLTGATSGTAVLSPSTTGGDLITSNAVQATNGYFKSPSSTNLNVYAGSGGDIIFNPGATSRWSMSNSGGNFLASSDNATDIGASGANRPRDFYLGRNAIIGGKTTTYNGIATVSNGVPSEVATIDSTGLTANVGATTLYAVPASGAGLYRVSAYLVTTTAASVSSTMPNAQVVYTDSDSNTSVTLDVSPILGAAGLGQSGLLTANAVGTVFSGTVVVYIKASTTIQYQTVNYASTAGGMAYALRIKLEAL